MAFRKIFCPDCGQQTQVNDAKEFCFCLECGYKIPMQSRREPQKKEVQKEQELLFQPEDQKETDFDSRQVEQKLEEVAFYYHLSLDKKEAEKAGEEPVYYLKAQDLLVDLSQQYPEDYRIWWELSKPLDFMEPSMGADVCNQYHINEMYFSKALDLAGIEEKKKLIKAHDQYAEEKKSLIVLAERQRREQEKKQREQRERLKAEQQRAMQEKIQQEEEQRKQKEASIQRGIQQSAGLWKALAAKDYAAIDTGYFQFQEINHQVIGIFRVVSNVMYLMSFRVDANKNNMVYRDQTISIQFNSEGYAVKFDQKPLRIKGMLPPDNCLRIVSDGEGGYCVNNMKLLRNMEFVNGIMKSSKKSLMPFNKIFL